MDRIYRLFLPGVNLQSMARTSYSSISALRVNIIIIDLAPATHAKDDLRLTDTGPGMSDKEKSSLFER